jgi:hypothetical protein
MRTWAMVPGAASSAPVHKVWMESMATMPGGLPASNVARMSSTQVAAPSINGASARSIRAARMRTWAIASSPEI